MDINFIIEKLTTTLPASDITLFPPATLRELTEFEDRLKCPLPDDIKTLYLFCNGFESAEDLFRIVPLGEITVRLAKYKPNSLDFSEYMTYCDMWTIEINPSDPNDYRISNRGDRYRLLTNSLAEFLDRFLAGGVFEKGGLLSWHNEVDAQKNAQ
jgi:SMI1 / KNR4 family (SUKH-1)